MENHIIYKTIFKNKIMSKNILVINGNPKKESLCKSIAEEYIKGAKESQSSVKLINLRDLKFDPILHEGYTRKQLLEKDLKQAQEDILWADHIVFVYPTWWATVPALMKGFLDRTFTPYFAFKFTGFLKWKKLLKGRSAHIITTMNGPKILYYLYFLAPGHNTLKKSILQFSGISPVRSTIIDRSENLSKERAKKILKKIRKKGIKLK